MSSYATNSFRTLALWLPYSLGILGGFLLGRGEHPATQILGILCVLAGGILLFLQARRILGVLHRLFRTFSDKSSAPQYLREIPNAWSALEQEAAELRAKSERENRLREALLAHLKVGIVLFDHDHRVRAFNQAAQGLLGSSSRLRIGADMPEVFREPESLRCLEQAYQGDAAEWMLRRGARTLQARANVFPAETGGEVGSVLVNLDDITRQEALEMTRQKFISNASHELKTPVSAIRIAAENLQDGALVLPDGEPNLKTLFRSVERMTMLLEDITELSRIETGALRLAPESIQVGTFASNLMEDVSLQARPRDIKLVLDLDPELASHIFQVDPHRLRQLLENLLSNAIKFSQSGSEVHLCVSPQGHWMEWSVADQGPGISSADMTHIFERFYRSASARGVPGTGLGLAIVKHLALLMEGEVSVASELGRGSTFTLRLPMAD